MNPTKTELFDALVLGGPATTDELKSRTKCSYAWTFRCLQELKKEGLAKNVLVKTNAHRNGVWIWYHPDELAMAVQEAVRQIKSINSSKVSFTRQTSK